MEVYSNVNKQFATTESEVIWTNMAIRYCTNMTSLPDHLGYDHTSGAGHPTCTSWWPLWSHKTPPFFPSTSKETIVVHTRMYPLVGRNEQPCTEHVLDTVKMWAPSMVAKCFKGLSPCDHTFIWHPHHVTIMMPSCDPTSSPSCDPTSSPSCDPTFSPSCDPTFSPSCNHWHSMKS